MKKESKKRMKGNKGITLIALVVTIVVLLILAGITISTLFGENGVINAARRAEEETRKDQVNTEQSIQNLEDSMHGQLGVDTSSLAKIISTNSFVTSEQGNQIVSDKTGKPMIIPVGFKIAEDSATEIDKGVVIEDKEHNQYVWVPVSDSQFGEMFDSTIDGSTINYFGKLYNFTTTGKGNPINVSIGSTGSYSYREPDIITEYDGSDSKNSSSFIAVIGNITGAEFKNELQNKFNDMVKSVKEYKGFYIGRFEASSLNTNTPKIVRGVIPSTDVNWYNMYKNMQGIEKNANVDENVITNMIWGCQLDRTLDWIANTNSDIGYVGLKNSTSWGNYKDATFEYTTTSGTTTTTVTKAKNTSTLIPTGSTEYTKVNNIYNLASNAWMWTMEAYDDDARVPRGNSYIDISTYSSATDRYGMRRKLPSKYQQL